MQPSESKFNKEKSWVIYLPSLYEGFIVEATMIYDRRKCKLWEKVIFVINWFVWMWIMVGFMNIELPAWVYMIIILIVSLLLFVIIPSLAYLPWELKVRKNCIPVRLPESISHQLMSAARNAKESAKLVVGRSKISSAVAGTIVELLVGKVASKFVETAIEATVEEVTKENLSNEDKRAIQETHKKPSRKA